MTWTILTSEESAQLDETRANPRRWFERNDLAAITVTGKHRGRFLQALLTQSVDEKEVGVSRRACLCTPQGRIVGVAQLLVRAEDIVLLADKPTAEPLITGLLKYRVAERVKLVVDPDIKATSQGVDLTPRLVEEGETVAAPLADAVLRALRVQAGVPTLGADVDDGSTPLELGLWDVVNWKKGCYVGQEAIAMMAYRGKLRRHLCWARGTTAQLPSVGQQLRTPEGRRAGVVRMGYAAGDEVLGLVMVQRRAYTAGATLFANDDGDGAPLQIVETTIENAFDADPSEPST